MRILLADKDPTFLKEAKELLDKNHYTVDTVTNGEEVLHYLKQGSYDAVILDMTLPKADGISITRTIRCCKCALPIILISDRKNVDELVAGLDFGANDYLVKPIEPREFLARIRVLTRNQTEHGTVLHYGNLALDRKCFILSTAFNRCRLSNKEFQLMELLLLYPENPISTEQLMNKIWGFDSEADISIVWTYISRLRKKLNSLSANVRIQALRNLGYSLVIFGTDC